MYGCHATVQLRSCKMWLTFMSERKFKMKKGYLDMCSTYSASFLTQSKNWYNLEKDIHICTLAFSNDQKWPYNTLRENNSLCLIVAVPSMSGSTYTHCSVLTETECLKRHDTLNRFWQFAAILRWQKVDCSRYALICTYMEKKFTLLHIEIHLVWFYF